MKCAVAHEIRLSAYEMPAGMGGFILFHFVRQQKISQWSQDHYFILRSNISLNAKKLDLKQRCYSYYFYFLFIALKFAFFNEINPCGFVKCAIAHEIRLRRMKCLRAWVDLFYF
ncbi:MAG: hypothetical protein WCR95_05505, partial [Eubacteriales bacterium]